MKFLMSVIAVLTLTDGLKAEKKLYLTPYTHLDTQWLWTYPETIDKYLQSTLKENLALSDKYPQFEINFTGSYRYKLMKEYYPDLYAKMRSKVLQGKWHPSGNSVDEGDLNVVSPESIFRQILYSKRFFKKEFGTEYFDFLLPDTFGFPASLPTIISHAGLKGFSSQKTTWHPVTDVPFDIGFWQGPDGSEVLSAFNPGPYNGEVSQPPSNNKKWLARIEGHKKDFGSAVDYRYYGMGDRGGSPRENDVKKVLSDNGQLELISGRSDQFFIDMANSDTSQWPRYKGELLLTKHSAGSINSNTYMKRWNRKNEILADKTERVSSFAFVMNGNYNYPNSNIDNAWEKILAAQMHDILPGTSIPEAYDYSYNDELIAANLLKSTFQMQSERLLKYMDTDKSGEVFSIFNPLEIEREELIEIPSENLSRAPSKYLAFANDGSSLETQVGEQSLFVKVRVKPLSMSLISLEASKGKDLEKSSSYLFDDNTRVLSSPKFKITFDKKGNIQSIYSRLVGRDILSSAIKYPLLAERPLKYPSWNIYWHDRKMRPAKYFEGDATYEVVEKGPSFVSLKVTRAYQDSKFTQIFSLSSTNDRIDINNIIDWKESGFSLKASYPFSLKNKNATYTWKLGTVKRPTNYERQYEVPSQSWADMTAKDGSWGVSILDDGKYGWDKPNAYTLRNTLVFTPNTDGVGYFYGKTQDWGRQEFNTSIYPHEKSHVEAATEWEALRLNYPLVVSGVDKHKGKLKTDQSLLSMNSKDVAIRAIKKAEDSNHLVLRLVELNGKQGSTKLSFFTQITDAYSANSMEEKISNIAFAGNALELNFQPFEVKTLVIALKPYRGRRYYYSQIREKLTYTESLYKDFDDNSNSYNRKSIPSSVFLGDIRLRTNKYRNQQLMPASGQKYKIPNDKDSAYVLVSSTEDGSYTYKTNRRSVTQFVPSWREFIGSPDKRIFNKKLQKGFEDNPKYRPYEPESIKNGFYKDANIAKFQTAYKNKDGKLNSYQHSYIFWHRIKLNKGENWLEMPKNKKLKILDLIFVNDGAYQSKLITPVFDNITNRFSL